MSNFSLKICNTFGKDYIRVDVADLSTIEKTRDYLSKLECVHHARITKGKRDHITVYLQPFYETADSNSQIKTALEGYFVQVHTPVIPEVSKPLIRQPNMNLSQLNSIPENTVVVFISYSWDSNEHRKWVRRFSDDLRKYGVYTLLDQYEPAGTDLPDFMKRGIKRADKVLVIGTPGYAQKVDTDNCGVHFEDQIMSVGMYNGVKYKFVPVLRNGTFGEAFQELVGSKKGYDFSNDNDYLNVLAEIVNDLKGTAANAIPPVNT